MHPWAIAVLAAVAGYLLGAISFARWVTRIVAPQKDLTHTNFQVDSSEEALSGSFVSATTVSMHVGTRAGCATVVLDMLKLAVPTLAFKYLYPDTPYFLITAAAGMVGHIWPVYYGFKGGRGLSAVYGALFVIDFVGVFATAIGGMLLGMFILRDMLLAYTAGLWLLIPWLWFRTHDLRYVAYAVAVNLLFILGLIPELKQYVRLRRQGVGSNMAEVLELTSMGRGMVRIARFFGVMKEPAPAPAPADSDGKLDAAQR